MDIQIGTCSWKYESWQGLVYSSGKPANYLHEYSQHYRTVEVDQWFWSLFAGDKVVLPKPAVVREYAASVPGDFTFCVKAPNSITLTHHYKKGKVPGPLQPNPYFLSVDLMHRFLDSLEPLHPKLGAVIFQFEYLNKQKMPRPGEFFDRFGEFAEQLPSDFPYFVELRNAKWLNSRYFDFLAEKCLYHVFLQGYYMPSIFDLYRKHREKIQGKSVIRLHGPDRKGIEEQTGKDWSRIVTPKDQEIRNLVGMVADLRLRHVEPCVYVNNHFEGSAPRTIEKIRQTAAEKYPLDAT
ncbi:DUF72 domain-containing protein [Desulfopila sp. IMCC35008]|uniref:DUF72 domain-containing protein n=1 Tax=Desulfopila sp. IMCC35008 TaxID=2653858 RepID=UPI0013D8DBA7|nr:DUF72 domain-containing protein [Desulfopila sp. IMCC35008]